MNLQNTPLMPLEGYAETVYRANDIPEQSYAPQNEVPPEIAAADLAIPDQGVDPLMTDTYAGQGRHEPIDLHSSRSWSATAAIMLGKCFVHFQQCAADNH